MYSPGSVKIAFMSARPSVTRLLAGSNRTLPGPRYFDHIAVIPTGLPARDERVVGEFRKRPSF
jgi:hypothetical protein